MNNAVSVAPIYLLIKDHKKVDANGLPKTCPIVSSSKGIKTFLNNLKYYTP